MFYITNPSNVSECWEFLTKIRKIQKNPIIVIFEEFDNFLGSNNSNVGPLKTMFDGNLSIDNCLILATTNNLEKIPDALKLRPSRFKYVLNIEGIQSVDEVFSLLNNMISDLFTKEELEDFAEGLKGSTLDYIKQFAIDKIMDLTTFENKRNKKIGFLIN